MHGALFYPDFHAKMPTFDLKGDRLWNFAISIVLVKIGGDLRLAAVNGLIAGLAVMVLGAAIGKWVDSTSRLTGRQNYSLRDMKIP